MTLLYDQFNRPINAAKPGKTEKNPLPVAPLLESNRDYVADGLTPERLGRLFKQADQGDMSAQAELFEQLEERDGHLLCERDKRRNVILDMDFTVIPASDDARDQKVAEFVEETLGNLSDWDDTLVCLQDAVGKGYTPLEPVWEVSSGQAVPTLLEFIEQKRLVFHDERGVLSRVPRLLTDANPMGEEIPPWKMMLHVYGGKSGHPTRSAIFRVCAWLVLYKHYSIKDWLTFAELFGMPLRLGKYKSGATEDERKALVNAVRMLGTDAAGIISESTMIDFIENKSTARGDLWGALTTLCNDEMSKAILGQTLTTSAGEKGSYSLGKVHDGVRLALMRADGRAIASTIRQQLVKPIVGFNFGWDTPLPKYEASFGEQEDKTSKSVWIKNLLDGGMSIPRSFIEKGFNIPEAEEGEEMVSAIPQGQPVTEETVAKLVATVIAKAEPETTATADTLATLNEATKGELDLDALLAPARQLLDECDSLVEYRAKLAAVYGDQPLESLANTMAQAMTLAQLAGRFDVNAEIAAQGDD